MLKRGFVDAELRNALPHCLHAVDASENQPVIVMKIFQCRIKRAIGTRLADLDERNFYDFGSAPSQLRRESARLKACSANEDENARERSVLLSGTSWSIALALHGCCGRTTPFP